MIETATTGPQNNLSLALEASPYPLSIFLVFNMSYFPLALALAGQCSDAATDEAEL
jgi:hypothetical protein